MLIGDASHAYAASVRARSSAARLASASFAPRARTPAGDRRHQPPHRFDQRRQRRLAVRGHRQVCFRVTLEVLVVGLDVQIPGRDGDQLHAGLRCRP